MRPLRIAIVGATGMIGQTTLSILEEWRIPIASLQLYASQSSAGKSMSFANEVVPVRPLAEQIDVDYVILALSAELALEWATKLSAQGLRVIYHSSAHRMDLDVPLVIPEINKETIQASTKLVANPNCSASVVLMALAPLEKTFGIRRTIISTYQSVSGAGIAACEELRNEVADVTARPQVFKHRIAGNLIPEIGVLDATFYTGEETKINQEIRKILNRPEMHVSSTAVRVPVEIGHSAAVSVELCDQASLSEIEKALSSFPGLKCDGHAYSTPLDIAGTQDVRVGRVRLDPREGNWLHFWVVGDNTRKGAASNAIQIIQAWECL